MASDRTQTSEERLAAMRGTPRDTELEYHAITLTADKTGRTCMSIDSRWIGWLDLDRCIELRQSRILNAGFARGWEQLGRPYYFVLDFEELLLFLVAGGHALVERTIAETAFPELTTPQPAYLSGQIGFVVEAFLEAGAEKRAPSPKVRMAVLRRDGRRCRICGRRPDDDVDIVLHVHHIRPWALGGMTEMSNLITICHTCHGGLDPHYDPGLFDYVDPRDAATSLAQFTDGVRNYRRAASSHSATAAYAFDPQPY